MIWYAVDPVMTVIRMKPWRGYNYGLETGPCLKFDYVFASYAVSTEIWNGSVQYMQYPEVDILVGNHLARLLLSQRCLNCAAIFESNQRLSSRLLSPSEIT